MVMEDLTTRMAQVTRAHGSQTCEMEKEKRYLPAALFMKETGRIINDQASVPRVCPMVEYIEDDLIWAFMKVMALSHGLMQKVIGDSGSLEKWMVPARWNGQMADAIMANGAMAKWKARANSNSKMVVRIVVATSETSNRVTAFM